MRRFGLLVLVFSLASTSAATQRAFKLVLYERDLPRYSPPGHRDTVNVRLVDREVTDAYEMIHGVMAPGAVSDAHQHVKELQVGYILSGEAQVTLGNDPPLTLHAGSVFRIPPGILHRVVSTGNVPLDFVAIYSPPLP